MNNRTLATANAIASASDSDSEWIIVEDPGIFPELQLPKDLASILKGMSPMRTEIQLLPAGLLQLKDQANYEGALAARVGTEQTPACNRCQTNARPFPACYTVEEMLDGACAGCRFDGLEVECSFHESFLRVGSEEALSLGSRSNRGPESWNEAESSIRLPSSSQVQSLSPSPQHSATLGQRPPKLQTRAVANRQKNKRKVRKVQQRGWIDFKKDLIQVNKSVCGDVDMSDEALQVVNDYVNDMFNQIVKEAAAITVDNKKSTLSKDAIKAAFRLVKQLTEKECNAAIDDSN